MKNIILASLMMISTMMMAQEKNEKHEVVDQMVLSTYFHDNGTVKQKGFYNNGKLHGQWVSYDENGKKVSMGQYENGSKVGKWFFWTDGLLNEVDYSESRIASVTKWTQNAVVQNK
jgi:antitoxin component YwqK of YwqJK toxin-antitoxin module